MTPRTSRTSGIRAPGLPLLVRTRLQPPVLHAYTVARPRLASLLDNAAAYPLVLVTAPPGFGKTTAITAWLRETGRPHAWLSVEPSENDQVRFATYVVAAIRRARPKLGAAALAALQDPNVDVVQSVVPALLDDISLDSGHLTVVLDDYDAIASDACHAFVAAILDGARLSIVISSRLVPPLDVGRLRSEGGVAEIGAADLRFSEAEVGEFLTRALGAQVDRELVAAVAHRTDGWPAALNLAVLAIRGKGGPEALRHFRGWHPFFVDYLRDEFLASQPPHVSEFLSDTAVLERLSGPLCDAVTGRDDSTALLQALERGYAFVSSLDQRHEWFRYHPLLREAMQNELRRSKPSRVPVLLDRAARWHEANGTLDEASRYALQAGNHEFLGHLIARHYLVFIRGGHQSDLRSLLDAVDLERLGLTRAAVGFVAALEAGLAGSSETEVERHVAEFEAVGFGDVLPTGIPSAEAGALFVRAAFLHGDLSRPRAAGERAITGWPDNRYLDGIGRVAIGYSHYLSGQLDAARVVLAPFGLTFDARRPLISIFGVSVRALLEVAAGNVRAGLVAARSAYRAAGRSGLTDRVSTAIAHEALAAALAASGDETGALPLIERAVQLTSPNQPLQRASALLTRATILAGIGDRDGSIASAAEARTLVLASRDPGALPMRVEAVMQPLMASMETARDLLISSLTPAERSVLQLLPSSLSRREIAARLYVSPDTVKTHSRRLYQKLGARTRSEAVETAKGFGLIE